MKKAFSILFCFLLLAGCFSACSAGGPSEKDSKKIKIVTTIFPEYDWIMNILGDNPAGAEVLLLQDNGVDLHSFQPTAADIMNISTCDLFIYIGGESDDWVEEVLHKVAKKDLLTLNLLESLGSAVKEEEVMEGMEAEDHEHEGAEHDEDDEHKQESDEHDEKGEHEHEEKEYDEHVWLSLKNAAALVKSISEAIEKTDPANAAAYQKNAAAYIEKLNKLDEDYRQALAGASYNTLLFGDRFPFRYLVDDYGLSYFAAFSGCSTETEASFKTITFLSQKLEELSLPAVMTLEGSNHKIAEAVIKNTASKNYQILTLDSMQGTTAADVKHGASYLSIMEKNLSVLKEALR